MAYILNGIDLATYGIFPSQVPESNLALTGQLDFPKRLGKAYHVWDDQDGIEPYVSEELIRWKGRDLKYYGYMNASSKLEAMTGLKNFYNQLGGLTDLVELETPWGNFQVFVKDAVEIDQNHKGVLRVVIPFREPDCGIGYSPSGGISKGIDGVDFEDFGFTYLRLDGQWNRPATKEIKTIGYLKESYQVTKANAREMVLKGLFISSSYAAMKAKVDQLAEMLAKPGVRTLQIDGEPFREFFCCNGFSVSQINVRDTVSAYIEVRMMEVGQPTFIPDFLTDEFGAFILSNGQKILIRQ